MTTLHRATRDLVIANRILANEGVLDAYAFCSDRPCRPAGSRRGRAQLPGVGMTIVETP